MEIDSRQSIMSDESIDITEREQELEDEQEMQVRRQVRLATLRAQLEEEEGLPPGASIPGVVPQPEEPEPQPEPNQGAAA